ncbi:MAG: peptidase M14, partial [Gammaproteobacteria bacterium]|nr:peptidase M14 [Gammaproteobacteria bacterium]
MKLFNELDYLPEGLLGCQTTDLHAFLQKPTLIHLQGRNPNPVFISVLMHGNETVGWDAICRLLPKYTVAGGNQELPRSLSLFIGNIEAAKESVRALPDKPDYNRIWPGCGYESAAARL